MFFSKNKELLSEIRRLASERDLYKDLYLSSKKPISIEEAVLGPLLKRGINWFDYKSLPVEERRNYYAKAQELLRNDVFCNELSSLKLDLIQEIALRSKDFQHVMVLRGKVGMAEVLVERIKSIDNPDKPRKSTENVNSAI